jgi:hypothetical protein
VIDLVCKSWHQIYYQKNNADKYSVLVFGRKRIQARHKDIVKVTVKFIRKGILYKRMKVRRTRGKKCN